MASSRLSTRAGPAASAAAEFVLGRDRFAQISAVEGIALTNEMRETLNRFDREGLSPTERRRAIFEKFSPTR